MNFLLIQEAHLLPAARLKLQILPSQLRCCSLPCFPPLCLSSGMSVPVLFHKTLTEKLPGLKTLSVPTYLKKQAFFLLLVSSRSSQIRTSQCSNLAGQVNKYVMCF